MLCLPEEAENDLVARENERERDLCKKKLFGAKKTSLFGFLVKNVKVCFTLTLTMMKRTTRRSPGLMFRRKHFLHISNINYIICPDTNSYIANILWQ